MTRINIGEAKAQLSKYMNRVAKGETFILCRRGNPIAEIGPAIVWSGEMNRRAEDYFQGVILSSDIVHLLIEPENRRSPREGNKSRERKTRAYRKSTLPVHGYLASGLLKEDLAWDYKHGFISILNTSGVDIRDDPTRKSRAAYYGTYADHRRGGRR